MGNILLIGIACCVVWYLSTFWTTEKKESVPTPILPLTPTAPINSVAPANKPRWHKFDILLELQDCLRECGQDEKKINEICASIAPLLLGAKHE